MTLQTISGAIRTTTLFALAVLTLCAQTYQGGVRGLVQDPDGAAIPAAKVTLVNQATGVLRSTVCGATGEYSFSSVDPATYNMTVEAPGFKRMQRNQVVVGTQEFVTLDVKLDLGSVNESVMVTAEVPLIETSNEIGRAHV